MIRSFKTSFGHAIPFREGYRLHKPPMFDPSFYREIPPMECDFGILADIFEFSRMVNWLDTIFGVPQKFAKLLDVGGNTGLIARLFKATGRAHEVQCLDLCDLRQTLPMDRVKAILKIIQLAKDEIMVGERGPHLQFVLTCFSSEQNQHPAPLPSSIWSISPDSEFTLAKFICEDFYNQTNLYDCITSFSSLDHFTPSKFFRKASSMLVSGGMLYIWHINWYWVLNSPQVYGEFPYAAQRLTPDDLWRYFDEFHPEDKTKAQKAYGYWHNGETGYVLNDYIDMGVEAGLLPVNVHRLTPNSGRLPSDINGFQLQGDHGITTLNEVLRDIHCFKPNVTMLDLITQSFFFAFKKP